MAKIPESLIDDILESTKKYGESEPVELYSQDRVDALLSDLMGEKKEETVESKPEKVKFDEPETNGNETSKEEPVKVVPATPKKSKFTLDLSAIKETQKVEEDVSVEINSDGQMGLIDEGEPISIEAEDTSVEEDVIIEERNDDSQISIEKTRMFNEVNIRGAYNPNISHNLGNKVARTTTGDGEALSTPVASEDGKTKYIQGTRVIPNVHQKTIETPGVVVKKNKDSEADTFGFEPIPTIVRAEDLIEHEDIRSSSQEPDNQLILDGFADEEPVVQQSEEEVERQLRENRKNVVKDFVKGDLIFQDDIKEFETRPRRRFERRTVNVACEYFGPKGKNNVKREFSAERKNLLIKIIVLSIIGGIMAILAAVAGAENGNFELYNNNEYVYVIVQLLLLLGACVVCHRSFINAFNGIKNKTVDMDTVVSVSAIAAVLQCLVAFGFTDSVESVARLLAGAAVVPMILKTVGEFIRCKNDAGNFDVISNDDEEYYSVQNIADANISSEIAKGVISGNHDIKYSAKIGFPRGFVGISRSAEITGPLLKIAVPIVCGIAIIAGVVYGIVSKNIFAGVSTMAGVILMGLPAASGLLSAVNLYSANKNLNKDGAIINGYSAVEDAVNSNGVVIDACDAFEQGGCNIEGMKMYHKMRIDEAILYTASVIIASGGVMADIFDGVILGKRSLLLPVESLAYEEKLGCSCWIHNHRVLVGNRELLVHHNVEVPDKELEEKFRQNGKNVIYLAIEGKIAAMFVVVYKANEETAKYIRELEKDGLAIFFRTADANITEQFLEKEFGLPSNVVKIINPVAGEMFTKIKDTEIAEADAKVIHKGSIKGMLKALHSAFAINSFVNSSKTVQLVASALGVATVVLLAFLSGLAQIGVWQILIYQAVWSIVLSVLPLLRKI